MTIKSWTNEYYPVTSDDCLEGSQFAHSKLKWKGLRPEHLKRHELTIDHHDNLVNQDPDDPATFVISGATCALCVQAYTKWADERYVGDKLYCEFCQIFLLTGHTCHDEFSKWVTDHDPEPMIALLSRVSKDEQL